MNIHPVLHEVTSDIVNRSKQSRTAYLNRMNRLKDQGVQRKVLACGNLAHAFAACNSGDKKALKGEKAINLAIISSYNEMLSAHEPFHSYPDVIKEAANNCGAVAQFAGGVPAMCDGVTQGQPGMELSLFSRDVIAMATAIAMSHNMFDGAICLGVCDKIVPGLLMGSLSFAHLPVIFVPAGPMPSGLPNKEKARIRQLYANGEVGRDELLRAESKSYHSAGTCTFYGTANSNQMLMEIMGLQLPGSSFINPGTPLRSALTTAATKRLIEIANSGSEPTPLCDILDEKAIVNGIVGLLASGGSTNHAIHLVAIAAAAGIVIDWGDFSRLSAVIPLLCKVYPNGQADVNHFHAAGGLGLMIRELLNAGLLHEDVKTVAGPGLSHYHQEPFLDGDQVTWREGTTTSLDPKIVASVDAPFQSNGGLSLLEGNLGRGVIKTSAVKPEHRKVHAPAVVFTDQNDLIEAFKAGKLNKDFVAVVVFQGPKALGMPELHKLTPSLGILQDQGYKVALVTDGRMSGASGKVPAAIHMTPEALANGPLGLVRDGDMILLDADNGILRAEVDEATWASRKVEVPDLTESHYGMGRELFANLRATVSGAEQGASIFPYLK